MAIYIFVSIGVATVPFFIYCLWHIVREMKFPKKWYREPS